MPSNDPNVALLPQSSDFPPHVAADPGHTHTAASVTGAAPALAPTSVTTANFPAAVSTMVLCDTTGGTFTVTLPTAPADRSLVGIKLVAGTNVLTVHTGGSDVVDVVGGATSASIASLFEMVVYQYQAATHVWLGIADYNTSAAESISVLTQGSVGNVQTVTDAAITSGQNTLQSTSAAFTSADVGKYVQVVGAGAPYVLSSVNGGVWLAGTDYAQGDRITYQSVTYVAGVAITHPASGLFNIQNWMVTPANSQTLMAKIVSVSGGVATLTDVAGGAITAGTTVTNAKCVYGTDDSATLLAQIGSGGQSLYFPGGRTYFAANLYLPSNTTLEFGPGATFIVPYWGDTVSGPNVYTNEGCIFRLHASNRTSNTYLTGVQMRGIPICDYSHLTAQGSNLPRAMMISNASDFEVDGIVAIGIPGTTGNAMAVGSNGGSAHLDPTRGSIGSIYQSSVRSRGSSAVQLNTGQSLRFGTCATDGGVAFRIEMDNNPGVTDNVLCELASCTNTSGMANAAVMLDSHTQKITNVTVLRVHAEGGADGAALAASPGGSVTNCAILGGNVVGGGCGTTASSNDTSFPGVTVSDMYVTGVTTATLNPDESPLRVGFTMADGMVYDRCVATSGAGYGFQDNYSTTGVRPYTSVTLRDCQGNLNTTNGVQVSYLATLLVERGAYNDNPALLTPTTAQMFGSTQDSGTLAGWASGNGAASVSGTAGVLTVTSVTPTTGVKNATAHTATGASGIAVTGSHFYRFSFAAGVGTAPAGTIAIANAWFYDSSNTYITPGLTGGPPVIIPGAGTVTSGFTVQAPSNATHVAMVITLWSGTVGADIPASATWTAANLTMAEMPGLTTQQYGLSAAVGTTVIADSVSLASNGSGRATGAGTVIEIAPADGAHAGAIYGGSP